MKNLLRKKGDSGFTIIEVTIVLAIAGLIMAIVFVAVPALERNARNTQRRNDASHLTDLVNEYSADHAGTLPTTIGTGSGDLNISTENWSLMNAPKTANIVTPGNGPNYGSTTDMYINEGYTCNTATNTISTNASDRAFAIGFQVETSGSAIDTCIGG